MYNYFQHGDRVVFLDNTKTSRKGIISDAWSQQDGFEGYQWMFNVVDDKGNIHIVTQNDIDWS